MDAQTVPALPKELNKTYEAAICKNVASLMCARGISQSQLSAMLEERGLRISQGNLSLILSGKKHIPLSLTVHLCELFQVSLSELVDEPKAPAPMPQVYSDDLLNLIPSLGEPFITDPASPEFHGYLQTYHFYILPIHVYETKPLTGTLTLEACGSLCEATLRLNTNQIAEGTPLQKHYRGRVIISTAIDAVYILLSSAVEGDLSVISFRHYRSPHHPLDCRVAAVLTNQAGEFHAPTLQRMFLSRTPVEPEHLPLLLPHLKLNSSTIHIPAEQLQRLQRSAPEYEELIGALTMLPSGEYYRWTEEYVVGAAKHFLPKEQVPVFLSRLRERCLAATANKTSRRADFLAMDLMLSLGYYRDHDL